MTFYGNEETKKELEQRIEQARSGGYVRNFVERQIYSEILKNFIVISHTPDDGNKETPSEYIKRTQ